MEECESLDSEMTELQEFQGEASDTISQDDDDEVEELQNSLREVVQDQSVKPKLQCLMVDPSFSMVTVQSEDSGIVWETSSSRCSTPWASETSSTSEGYSMEGSGAAGKITIVFDEDKIVRRRTRSGGRSSRLGDRLSRPGSSRSASALGVERLEMAEVSLPNVKQEQTTTEPSLEEIRNKDQQLFSLISDGYEILNIRVPSKLPTVDEEESTELQDNLSYLDQTPKIKSRNHYDWTQQQKPALPEEEQILDHMETSKQDSSQPSADTELAHTPTPTTPTPTPTPIPTEGTSDIDYFEKFTLLDVVVPEEKEPELQEEAEQPAAKPQAEEQKPAMESATDSPASEESFVFVTDVEIVGEHLDEVFYGQGAPPDALPQGEEDKEESRPGMRTRRESQRSMKENGSVLFGTEETILTPIYISPGPPKIIDPILLEEPTAMSFMYSDLYEDAVGERRKSDEEYFVAENVAPERSYKRRLSDSEEADGYLQKFTLKDEIPIVDEQLESVEDTKGGRMMFPQSKFEMTGCLIRVVEEEDKEKTETEEPKMQEVTVEHKSDDSRPAMPEERREMVTETEDAVQESKLMEEPMEEQQVTHEIRTDQTDPPECSTETPHSETHQVDCKVEQTQETEPHQTEEENICTIESEHHCQIIKDAGKRADVLGVTTDKTAVTAPETSEEPPVVTTSEPQTETSERGLSEEEATDTKMVAADEEPESEAKSEASAGVEEPESARQEMLTSTEPSAETETSAESTQQEENEAAEVVPEAPVEVITDCDCAVHTVVEVTEKVVNEKEIQTQVQIDLKEVTSADVQAAVPESLTEGATAEHQKPEVKTEAVAVDQESEGKTEILSEVTKPVMADSDKEHDEILEPEQQQQEVTDSEPDTAKLKTEAKSKTPTEDVVNVSDELILLIPKGQAVEMDIEIGQRSEKTAVDTEALPERDSELQAPLEETKLESQIEVEPKVSVKEEELPRDDLDREYSPPAPVEEAATEEQKMELPQVAVNEEELPRNDLDMEYSPPAPVEEAATEEQKMEPPQVAVNEEELPTEGLDRESSPPAPLGEAATEEQKMELPQVAVNGEELPRNYLDMEYSPPAPVEEQKMELPQVAVNEEELPTEGLDRESSPPAPLGEAATEEQKMEPPQVAVNEEELPRNDLDRESSPPAPLEEAATEEQKMEPPQVAVNEEELPRNYLDRESSPPAPLEEAATEEQKMELPEVAVNEEELPTGGLDREYSPPAPVEEADTEEQKMERDLEEDKVVCSPLRSFTPQEDLSGLCTQDIKLAEARVEQKAEMENVPETNIIKEDVVPYIDLHREDIGQEMQQDVTVAEAPGVAVDELEYEVISHQDAKEMPGFEIQRDAEEPKPESALKQDEEMEMEVEKDEKVDLLPDEDLIEADYDIIDAEEESQARLAAELQGMDWFCLTCGCLLSEDDRVSGEHHSHEVNAVDKVYEDIKETLSDWISELQGRSENIEDLVSELELAYNSVEDQCVESEAAMQAQNEEMMALVMEQYNNMSVSMEEEKKAKLEQLYDQIVSFQESIDSTKATLETTTREAEMDARSSEDIHKRLKAALDSALSLELGPKGLLVFEDYAKASTSSSNLAQRKGIPVPQRPTLQFQEPGSATSTSVTVYWKVNPGDIIDCFQVYCMEDPQGAVSEEYRVTVKESYCVLEELEPDKMYKVWVMAVNYTGCSLPSERLLFRTAPSVPVINTERCTVMWDSATLRWGSAKQTLGQSYTLEYCRQYELEGEGLRSISGIMTCEQRVLLQPNENYLFYIKAVNEAGASEQSEAALISTKGTRFHLLKASAHPALELSEDQTTLHYTQEAHKTTSPTDKHCPSILGELLPAQGLYYWETIVSGSAAYRLGVAYSTANRSTSLGESSLSWCLQCIPTPSGYQLLHNDVQSSVFVIEMPERVGTLLDYQLSRLSFYNAQSGQLLGTFRQHFTQPCHPALALELPGSLEVSTVLEVPEFTKDS